MLPDGFAPAELELLRRAIPGADRHQHNLVDGDCTGEDCYYTENEVDENPIMLDETLDKLEAHLKNFKGKPDNLKRWTRQLIERCRVSELAAKNLIDSSGASLYASAMDVWGEAQMEARMQLRREGKIR